MTEKNKRVNQKRAIGRPEKKVSSNDEATDGGVEIFRRSSDRTRKGEKGTLRMTRLLETKKDVTSCEKPRLGANTH